MYPGRGFQVQGLSLRGRAFHLTTPAVRDIGGASICIRLEENGEHGTAKEAPTSTNHPPIEHLSPNDVSLEVHDS